MVPINIEGLVADVFKYDQAIFDDEFSAKVGEHGKFAGIPHAHTLCNAISHEMVWYLIIDVEGGDVYALFAIVNFEVTPGIDVRYDFVAGFVTHYWLNFNGSEKTILERNKIVIEV